MNMLKVAFLVEGVGISGGINVIFQHAMHLAIKNYDVSIITKRSIEAKDIAWHPLYDFIAGNKEKITWYSYNDLNDVRFDVAISTWWRTFYDLWKVNAAHYVYFVQSIESRFYPESEISLRSVVEATYELNLGFITECHWISKFLQEGFGHKVPVALNGVDKKLFSMEGDKIAPTNDNQLRVLVEGPIDIAFKNVPKTIQLARESMADEIWLLTSSDCKAVPGVKKVFSQIPLKNVSPIYRSCDVIIKLSYVEGMFGPPLEMFHCGGTSIVYDVTGYNEYIEHDKNGLVVKTDDTNQVIQYINDLKENRSLLETLKKGACETAQMWPDWQKSNDQFEAAMLTAMNESKIDHELLKRYSKRIWHIFAYKNH
jgi:O-antigen biosynthesis protein